MRIDAKAKIGGVPIVKLRPVIKRSGGNLTQHVLAAKLKITASEAATLITALKKGGFIEPDRDYPSESKMWKVTIKGNALANATAAKPLKRSTADRKLEDFLKRVEEVRDDPYFLFKVKAVYVFGSYLKEKQDRLGDIDLAVILEHKEPNWEKHLALCQKRREQAALHGKNFKTFVDQLAWPEDEVWLKLKSRSRGLSLHIFNKEMAKISKHLLIYKDPK